MTPMPTKITTLALGAPGTSEPLVVGYRVSTKKTKSAVTLSLAEKALPAEGAQWLSRALENTQVKGEPDETRSVTDPAGRLIIATALPVKGDLEQLRRAAGAASRALAGHARATFAIEIGNSDELAAIAEGALLGAYQFHQFKGSSVNPKQLEKITIAPGRSIKNSSQTLKRSEIIIKQVLLVRDLINMPPSYLTPTTFITLVKKLLPSSVKVQIKSDVQLRNEGYGGITAVGQGSANPPRLLHLSYRPAKARRKYAYVGKGITFDTGGLALKPAQGMEAMKSDMSGAAAVVGAIIAIAELKIPVAIDAWAPLAENMVSESATRPSDVITIYGGKTVEVLNPDAEGRLILADALVRAVEVSKDLDGIIDVATLTGAQIIALGKRTAAVMGNDDRFRDRFLSAAKSVGENFWPMPLPVELRPSLDSPTADLANIGERMGGMLVAGLFLREFVPADLPWLHLDIAGPSYNEGEPHGYTPVGGVGFAVRSLVHLAEVTSTR
ncbi:MAG: leucyl aminopeptidase [Actinomycetota bacterium]